MSSSGGLGARLFVDIMSQPSRALLLFCRSASVPHQVVRVNFAEKEHKTDEFAKLQPLKTIPLVVDEGVPIRDSIAAARYLSQKYDVDDHWFPKDPLGQARVDEYLHWQQLNTRCHCWTYSWRVMFTPMQETGKPGQDRELEAHLRKNVEGVLDKIEQVFLDGGQNNYVAGGDRLSVADIFACCELEQPFCCGYDVAKERPLLSAYMSRVRQELNPHYDDCHEAVYKIAMKNFKMDKRSE